MDNKKIQASSRLPDGIIEVNVKTALLLTVFTLGLYGIYWQYVLIKNTRMLGGRSKNCLGELLLILFVPFYSIYWWYTRGGKVRVALEREGYEASSSGKKLAMWDAFGLAIVSLALMQDDCNALGVIACQQKAAAIAASGDEPLDKNIKLMTPTQMVIRRFFRSKLSIVGLIMVVGLFLFSFLGPVVYPKWGQNLDPSQPFESEALMPYSYVDETGVEHKIMITTETVKSYNNYAPMSWDHLLGTDDEGYDIFTRLMYAGRISLLISFLAVFTVTALGIVIGGIAGYYGGVVDNIIMRACDIFMCVPGIPLMIIIGTAIGTDGYNVPPEYRIYVMMFFLTLFSWSGTARLVRGQILSIREQEYMIAAEAMGYSGARKIFKHLIPNVMPQLIVQMTLSLGSMILYESTLSYLGMGVQKPLVAWGTMVSIITSGQGDKILTEYFNIWGAPGICIIIAVLGFNFVGDGLRDALDPKMRR